MAKSYAPRYTTGGVLSSDNGTGMAPTLTTAANDYTGVSTNNKLCFTAEGSEGSRIAGLRFKAIGTNVQTVARIYYNNGSAHTNAANNSFVGEVTLPATTASSNAATIDLDWYFPGGYADLPAGFRVYVGLGTTVAAGWVVTPIQAGRFNL